MELQFTFATAIVLPVSPPGYINLQFLALST